MADTTRNVAIRYSLDSSDVRAQLDQLGQTGDAAMQKIGDATDAVTPKLDALQSKTDATADSVKALSATAPGMSPLTDAMNAYGDAVAKTGAGLAELFDDSVSLTQNLADLKAGTDAAGAATVQLFQSLATGALATADSNYAKTLAADIRDMMRATGDSFASYAATADAAKALNTDAASASAMIDHLRGVIVGTDDASKAARATLEGLGISLQDAVPSDAPAILQAFIDKEQQYADSRQKTAAIEQVTGQSSVAALKSIAAAQDFTNQKTQAAAALQGELTLRSQQAAGDIAAIKAKPGYIDEIIASIAKATTVSDEWAADSALSSQQVGQGFEKAAVGAKEIDFGAIHDGWMQARLGLEDYVQSIQADLIPSISRYLGLTTNRVPVTIQSDGRQAQPDAPDDATIEAVNRYSSALDLERQTLQLTDQQQKDVKESASAYNDVMNIFSGKSPQWVSQHGDLIKSLTDEKIVTDTVSEAVSNQAKVKDDFKKVNLDLANDLETLNGIQEQAAKQAAADEQRRQDVIKGIKDQTTAEVALLDAYRQGKDVYQTVQEVEAILTAQRQLGKGATDDEKDAVANLTTTLFESKSALEAAQKATQDKAEADKKAAAAAVEAQKKFAEQEVTVAKDISSSVATYLVDGLTKSTTTGKTLFQNLWDTALEGAKRFAVKVAATLLEQQILLPITLSLVNSAPSLFGVGNATALASALTGGGGSAFGTVASGASLLSAGNSLTGGGSIFGSSGLLGGLFGGGSAALPAVTGLTDFGAAGSSFLVPAFGEGAAASGVGAAGGLFGSLGGIGSAIGAVAPYLAIAGIAGTLLGSLFGGPPQNNDGLVTIGNQTTNAAGQGRIGIAQTTSDHQDISATITAAQQVVSTVNAFADKYNLNENVQGSDYAGISVGANRNTLYGDSSAASIADILSKHLLSSSDPTVNNVLQTTTATDLATLSQQIDAVEAGTTALNTTLENTGHALSSTQSQLIALGQQFTTDTANAVQFGSTVTAVQQAYAGTFNTQVADALQSIDDPLQAALAAEQRDADQRLATAKQIGADINQVEELNGQRRLAIVQQYADSFNSTLYAAQGRSYLSQLVSARQTFSANATDDLSQGLDPNALYAAQVSQAINGLDKSQLDDVISFFQNLDPVVVLFAQTRERQLADTQAQADAANAAAAATANLTAQQTAMTTAFNDLVNNGGTIRAFLNNLGATSGSSASNLSSAQGTFNTDLALAQGGDSDALKAITGDASTLINAGKAQYGSGASQQALIAQITQALSALPATQDYDQLVLAKLSDIAASNAAGTTIGAAQQALLDSLAASSTGILGTTGLTADTASGIAASTAAVAALTSAENAALSQLVTLNSLTKDSAAHTAAQLDAVVTALAIINQTIYGGNYGTDSNQWWIRVYESKIVGNTGQVALAYNKPAAFAGGGDFGGGLRLVGERGPELELTGASRILNNSQLAGLFANGNSPAANDSFRNAQLLAGMVSDAADRIIRAIGGTNDRLDRANASLDRLNSQQAQANAIPQRLRA